jgi:hypothetical protein
MNDDIETPLFHVNILKQYIKALIINVNPELLPSTVNLIFDSGAVNGLTGIGAALYIHHLAEAQYIKINKISGCSIGALIAVWYSCGCPDTMYTDIDTLFSYYKANKNFFIFEEVVRKVIYQLFQSDTAPAIILNEKLYINYYDTKKKKQRVVSKFKSREHLITCILRSSHIPFLTSPFHKYEGRYIDGISPYLFGNNNHCKNLFIQLMTFTSPFKTLNVKREKNIYSRLITGVVATNDFFINNSSQVCSYVNYKTKIELYWRLYFCYFILYLIDSIVVLKKNIPSSYKTTVCYNKVCSFANLIWLRVLDNLT